MKIKDNDVEKVKKSLLQCNGIISVQTIISETENKILIETNLPSAVVQKQVENETNSKAILRLCT